MTKVYHVVTSPRIRRCVICLVVKRLKDFQKNRSCLFGYNNQCKKCRRRRDKGKTVIVQPFLIPLEVCTRCHIEKLPEEYGVNNAAPDGHLPYCKECSGHTPKKPAPFIRPGYRLCNNCEKPKPIGEFSNSRNVCQSCYTQINMKWYYEHPERVKERNKRRQSDPEYIEYHREKERTRYNTIPEVRQQVNTRGRAWNKTNRLKRRENESRRDARKQATKTDPVSYKVILERDGYFCYICEQDINPALKYPDPGSLTFDHEIPLIPRPSELQGTHTTENIHPSHLVCNFRKKNKPYHLLTPYDRRGP
jgi:hypothetical protein